MSKDINVLTQLEKTSDYYYVLVMKVQDVFIQVGIKDTLFS